MLSNPQESKPNNQFDDFGDYRSEKMSGSVRSVPEAGAEFDEFNQFSFDPNESIISEKEGNALEESEKKLIELIENPQEGQKDDLDLDDFKEVEMDNEKSIISEQPKS